jgi:hypothetical protein
MEERRTSARINTNLTAQWETASGTARGIVTNGSAGGCFVRAQVEEPGDEPIQLSIRLPNGRQVRLWGQVAYYLPLKGFGLHFNCPSEEDGVMLGLWRNYLRTLQRPADEPCPSLSYL